jgi:hypothetical protein
MKILKLLNKNYLSIFIISIFFLINPLNAEDELIDIWKIEKKVGSDESQLIIEEDNSISNSIIQIETDLNTKINTLKKESLDAESIKLAGLYDPEENGLNIGMWINSDGNEIKSIFSRINKINLSKDAKEILNITLLTNSYYPVNNISEENFISFKINYLIQNKDLKLIEYYLKNNDNNFRNAELIKYYVNTNLANSNLKNACDIFSKINFFNDDYLNKFKIYCLVNKNNREEAQLLYDLLKELGFSDNFYEDKFNFLMGYVSEASEQISEKDILDFHLSHRTISNFEYEPTNKTPKIIWKYLSSSNLLENIDDIDLGDLEKISLIEKATHNGIYTEQELFEFYKRFQFNIDQLLNVKETYKLLLGFEGRALLYQRLILTKDTQEILDLSSRLKKSFIDENISNAFNEKLSKILIEIKEEDVPSNYFTFYQKNLNIQNPKKVNIKINNKVIHQSKLLNYFKKSYEIKKIEKETNDLFDKLYKNRKNKDYSVSKKDLMLLESLKSDGVQISIKYKNLFKFDQSNVPTDIQLLINNSEIAMVLLRIVEIIGEDDLNELDSDTLHFIINAFNQLNIDPIRNNILLKVLPLKV